MTARDAFCSGAGGTGIREPLTDCRLARSAAITLNTGTARLGASKTNPCRRSDRFPVRCVSLLCLCLLLSDCTGLRTWRDAMRSDSANSTPPAESLVQRRAEGQSVSVPALLPEPGNVWQDVLPSDPARAPAGRRPEPPMERGVAERSPPLPAEHAAVAPPASPSPPLHSAASDPVSVQLAAGEMRPRVEATWRRLHAREPGLLGGHSPIISPADVKGRRVWRLRVGGFAGVAQANDFCARLAASRLACWVVVNSVGS